jgi:hypothetical protein
MREVLTALAWHLDHLQVESCSSARLYSAFSGTWIGTLDQFRSDFPPVHFARKPFTTQEDGRNVEVKIGPSEKHEVKSNNLPRSC